MNRRDFIGELATSFMACSGMAMLAVGSKLERDIPREQKEWFDSGWELWMWRVRSKHNDHSWVEFRETIFQRDGSVYTRPWNSLGQFTRAKVGFCFYPVEKVDMIKVLSRIAGVDAKAILTKV